MKRTLVILAALVFAFSALSYAQEANVIFSFESGLEGWDIPDWAYEKPDHVQKTIDRSDLYASHGDASLEIDTDFPGGMWTGAIVEVMEYFDWSDYSRIECDVYLPADAPQGLKASIILTVGDSWKWTEQSRSVNLIPGEWVTLSADLTEGSIDWRRTQVDDAFRADVRKLNIRVESNNQPAYTGKVYVDNIKVTK
jgi:hypothetical protein